MVLFRKLPRNQHETAPDATQFDDWYNAIIEYIYEANDIVDLLASIKERNFTPCMQTYNQKPGLIQLFFDGIPMQVGKNINAMINFHAAKECKNLREYTYLFMEELQKIQDGSDESKLNRTRLARETTLNEDRENNRFNQSSGKYINNNKNNNNNNNNDGNKLVPYKNYANNHNNNGGSRQMVPYKNPHEGRLNNLNSSQVCNDFYDKCDVEDYDEYIRNLHNYEAYNDNNIDNDNNSDDNSYDYDDVFGNRPEAVEGISPGANITHNLNYVNNIDGKPRQVCFDELHGKCLKGSKDCRYSHDPKDLEREAIKKHNEILACKYLPQANRPNPSRIVPTSIMKREPNLRLLSTVEGNCKVSNIKNDTSNDNSYDFYNRNNSDVHQEATAGPK
jgi:hypothetical protein